MKRLKCFFLIPIIILTAANAGVTVSYSNNRHIMCLHYDRDLVSGGIASAADYSLGGAISAGIIPHHLLASDMIAGFFSVAAQNSEKYNSEKYDTVLIISTSHFKENCNSDIVTASADWSTPYGIIKTDMGITKKILSNVVIKAEDNSKAVEADHGVAGIMPFVRYYMPEVKAAVILISNNLTHNRLDELTRLINEEYGKRTLIVLSADFSHYLNPEDASIRDKQTANVVENGNIARVLEFNDGNVDSPQGLALFMNIIKTRKLELVMLDHSSSVEKLPHDISNPIYESGITTYFVYAAYEADYK